MRIPVLLIAGLLALGPVAHAADESGNEAPPVAVTAPPPALSPAMDESGNPVVGRLRRTRRPPAPRQLRRRQPLRGTPDPGAGRRSPGAPAAGPETQPAPAIASEPHPAQAVAPQEAPRFRPRPALPKPPPCRCRPAPRRRPWRRRRARSRPIAGARGPPPGVPVDGLHRRRAACPHQVHERADEEELYFRRAGPGKITIISPRRVTMEEAYNVFLSVLQAKGFTTVTQGNTIKIVASREARQDTIRTGVSKETPPRSSSPVSFRCRTSRAPRSSR